MLAAANDPGSLWHIVGFVGHVFFGLRFVVQWIATEKEKKSVIPLAFWYLSLVGSAICLVYAIGLRNPVLIPAYSLNMIIYLRNLYFIRRKPAPQTAGAPSPDPSSDE